MEGRLKMRASDTDRQRVVDRLGTRWPAVG